MKRTDNLDRLARESFDLLVIGGGITGMGIAQDAATRGLRVALVDKADFAGGTSSKSSKLVHGGLRYLQQLDIAVTRESCHERNLLRKLAPGLVEPMPFLIPLFRRSLKSLLFSAGLIAYDRLAGVAVPTERHRRVDRAEVLRQAPGLKGDAVAAGLFYYDAVTDDARLTLTVARSAIRGGAVLANYAQVVHLLKNGAQVCGAAVRDRIGGLTVEVRARAVVNASGVWIDEVRHLDRKDGEALVCPAKGIHITVPQDRLPTQTAIVVPSARDGRLLFVIPWLGVTVVGTTDTSYTGSMDQPLAEADDIDYVLDAVNQTFSAGLRRRDILSTFAGLRPLIREGQQATKDVSRRHKIFESDSGLLTIAGGKLTTYRHMSAEVVDRVVRRISLAERCRTDQVPLIESWSDSDRHTEALPPATRTHLQKAYGAEAATIVSIMSKRSELAQPLLPPWPYVRAEILYAVRYEMAVTLEDVLARRTRLILQDGRQGLDCAEATADLMAEELGWDARERRQQLQNYTEYARRHQAPQ